MRATYSSFAILFIIFTSLFLTRFYFPVESWRVGEPVSLAKLSEQKITQMDYPALAASIKGIAEVYSPQVSPSDLRKLHLMEAQLKKMTRSLNALQRIEQDSLLHFLKALQNKEPISGFLTLPLDPILLH